MIRNFDSATNESSSSKELLTTSNIVSLVDSRRDAGYPDQDFIKSLSVEGQSTGIHEKLGSGGSKEVYDIEIDGEHFALGICGIYDNPEEILEKWKIVLKEPENTQFLREKGFFVNELCEIKSTEVNGISFPGIIMKRYQDHQFSIFDSKNPGRAVISFLDKETPLDDDSMLEIMSSVIDEIVRLISEGIHLSYDKFNLCESESIIHLYLNELGSMTVSEIPEEDIKKYVRGYSGWAISTIISSISYDTYQNNLYLYELNDLENSLQLKFEEKVFQGLAGRVSQ